MIIDNFIMIMIIIIIFVVIETTVFQLLHKPLYFSYYINHYTKTTSWEDPREKYQQIGKPTTKVNFYCTVLHSAVQNKAQYFTVQYMCPVQYILVHFNVLLYNNYSIIK